MHEVAGMRMPLPVNRLLRDTYEMSNTSQPLIVKHWVDAPKQIVWDAFFTPELFHQFFSPEGLSIPLESVIIEPWVGGQFACVMVFDETGEESPNNGILVEYDPPHRYAGAENIGEGFHSEWKFDDENGGTLITVTQNGLPPELTTDPQVLEAFRSSYRKLGRLLNVATENREA